MNYVHSVRSFQLSLAFPPCTGLFHLRRRFPHALRYAANSRRDSCSEPGQCPSDADPAGGTGTTELKIAQVLKGADRVAVGGTIRVPRYLPGDAKREALAFFGLRDGKWEFLGVRTTTGNALTAYLADSLALPAEQNLLDFCQRQLEHADAEVAADAFLELAKATEPTVAPPSFDAGRFAVCSPMKTPGERIGFSASWDVAERSAMPTVPADETSSKENPSRCGD